MSNFIGKIKHPKTGKEDGIKIINYDGDEPSEEYPLGNSLEPYDIERDNNL